MTLAQRRSVTMPLPEGAHQPGPALVGRESELGCLRQVIEHAATGCTVALVEGDPGMGVSALLSAARRQAVQREQVVLAGSAGGPGPVGMYQLFIDAFGPIGLLDELGDAGHWHPDADPFARQQLYRSVRERVAGLAGERGLVLSLDDLQWADSGSVDMLAALLRHPPLDGVVVLLGARAGRLPGDAQRAVESASQVVRLRLAPLDADAVAQLVPHATPRRQRLLLAASDGSPRYLGILAALPTSELAGLLTAPVATTAASTATFDAIVAGELRCLTGEARLVAGAAAMLGAEVEAAHIAHASGVAMEKVLDALDLLVEGDVLEERAGRLRFRHPLVRAAAYRLCAPTRRRYMHERIAAMLAAAGASPEVQADHVSACGHAGDRHAIRLLHAAAASSLASDPRSSARWAGAALRLVPPQSRPEKSAVTVTLARALLASGRPDTAADLLRALVAVPEACAAEAVLVQARCEAALGRFDTAHALLEGIRHDLSLTAGQRAEWHLLIRHACVRGGRSATPVAAAAATAAATADPAHAAGHAVLNLAAGADHGQPSVELAQRAATLVDGLDDRGLRRIADQLPLLVWSELRLERWSAAERRCEQALTAAHGAPDTIATLHLVRAEIATRRGQLRRAEAHVTEARDCCASPAAAHLRPLAEAAGWLLALWRHGPVTVPLGQLEDADGAVLADRQAGTRLAAMRAEVLLQSGRIEAARGALRPCLPDEDDDTAAAAVLALGAEIDAASGDLDSAQRLITLAEAAATRSATNWDAGCVARASAVLEAARGRWSAAEQAGHRAVARFDRAGAAIAAARSRLTLAQALHAGGDIPAANREIGRAKLVFERHQADWLVCAAVSEQKRVGASSPRGSGAASYGLSAREAEIARVVCEGLTNRMIAERLFLSVRTVDSHVARILTKVGVPSRIALMHRLRLDAGGDQVAS